MTTFIPPQKKEKYCGHKGHQEGIDAWDTRITEKFLLLQ